MGYKLIYNHCLGPSNIEYMASDAENNLAHFNYTGENRNWTLKNYATLHKDHHNILESLK